MVFGQAKSAHHIVVAAIGKNQGIRPGTTVDNIVTGPRDQGIGTFAAQQRVIAIATVNHIISGIARKRIGTVTARQGIVACPAIKPVIARIAGQDVIF